MEEIPREIPCENLKRSPWEKCLEEFLEEYLEFLQEILEVLLEESLRVIAGGAENFEDEIHRGIYRQNSRRNCYWESP